MSASRASLSTVSETLTSDVDTISTGVLYRSNTSKIRRKNPCAISIRFDRMFTTVKPCLHATDLSTFPQGAASATMFVPAAAGRREFRMRTGMFFSFAGITVAGCSTFAPKYASSAASSNEIVFTGRASGTILGSQVSTPSTSLQI